MKRVSLRKPYWSVKAGLAILFSLVLFSSCDNTARQYYLTEKVILKFDERLIKVVEFLGWDKHRKMILKTISSGDKIDAFAEIHTIARGIEDGYKLDKWKINGREYRGLFRIEQEDPIDENGEWVVNLSYTICKARPVMIKFNDANIIVKKNVVDSSYTEISTGEDVDEERHIRFYAKNLPNGKEIDKWFVNDKENEDSIYKVKIKDAIEEDGKKVINVTYTLK